MKPLNNLLDKVFGRLTVISRAPNPGTQKNDTAAYWNCICLCGKTAIIRGYSLTTGKTQSCGCLKAEAPHLLFLPESQPKYTPEEAAARLVWQSRYSEISFEDYYRLARLNCYYCGVEPNLLKTSIRKDAGIFKYNTLDRVDSDQGHVITNVVPACLICNRAKFNGTMQQFKDRVIRLINNLHGVSPQEYRQKLPIYDVGELHSSKFHCVECIYDNYHDGDLSLEQFYQLTMSKCYYCRAEPSNRRRDNKEKTYRTREHDFIYNGLDRIDSNFPHHYDNIVPCCKYCNFAKLNLSISEFNDWIKRLADHSHTWM